MMKRTRNKPLKSDAEGPDDIRQIGARGFLGLGCIVGALWNVTVFFKVPQTREEQMMLILVIALLLIGVLLLILPGKEE